MWRQGLAIAIVVGLLAISTQVINPPSASAATGDITTVAGTGDFGYGGDGGQATQALLDGPNGLDFDSQGNLYIAEFENHVIRRVDRSGVITTVAGTGSAGFSGDGGPATAAKLNGPARIAFDSGNNLYIADSNNHRVRKMDVDGVITTVAGTGNEGYNGDFLPGTQADLNRPRDIAVSEYDDLYIADTRNGLVRVLNAQGTLVTVAGGGPGDPANNGDGGPATAAYLEGPGGIALDGWRYLYIAQYGDNTGGPNSGHSVRRVDNSDGLITTVAGTGTPGFSGDGGPATAAQLKSPDALTVDVDGNLYIADLENEVVRRVDTSGIITTGVGVPDGGYGPLGDGGPATEAALLGPEDVVTNDAGDLFVADYGHERVRRVEGAVAHWISRPLDELNGRRLSGGYAEDPVNTATGNFTQAEVDLDFPSSVFGLDFGRTYNSRTPGGTYIGAGWQSFLDSYLYVRRSGTVQLYDEDGRLLLFRPKAGGGYQRPEEFRGDLISNADGTFTIAYDDGWRADYIDGVLAGKTNWDGQVVTYSYDDDGYLTAASSSADFSVAFSYDAGTGMLTGATASDGRRVSYGQDVQQSSLTTFTDAAGGVTRYEYNADVRLTRITDPDATLVVSNGYDAVGRVSTQAMPNGATVSFAYDVAAGTTTVSRSTGATTVYSHDHQGRLTAIRDALGAALTKAYDPEGNLTSVTDRRGGGLTQTFDGHANLLTRSGPEGVTERFAYDTADRLTSYTDGTNATTTLGYEGSERVPSSVTDANGKATTFEVGADGLVRATTDADGVGHTFAFDARRNLTAVTDAAGKQDALGYDDAGNLTSERTPLGNRNVFAYDALRRLTSTTDPTGASSSQTFTAGGRLASRTDAAGNLSTFAYDAAGRPERVVEPGGVTTTFAHDGDDNLVVVRRPGGADWTATYGPLGRRTSETDPTGVPLTYGYDADGNLTSVTDRAGATTRLTYDGRSRLIEEKDPLERTTTYAYDRADRVVSVTDPTGATTGYAYDAVGRPTTVTDAGGNVSTRRYSDAGRLTASEDPNHHTTTLFYDARGRVEEITQPNATVVRRSYDDDGRLVATRSPTGLRIAYGYDNAGRVTSASDPVDGMTRRTYTAKGELATLTDPTGGNRTFDYDPLGRLVAATDANNKLTRMEYDARGNLVRRTDARNGVEAYAYDKADRPLSRTDPLNRTTSFTYDNLGRLAMAADPSGRSAALGYNAAGELRSRTSGDGSVVSFVYDAAGRRTSMTDGGGTTSSSYDDLGRLTSTTSPDAKTLRFAYDPAGNRTSLTYPDDTVATFAYDANDQLSEVRHPQAGLVTYGYDADGRLAAENLPEAVSRSYDYDRGRLRTYTETRAGVARATTLGYDAASRITSETTGAVAKTFGYDPAGQLVGETNAGDTTSYAYDAVGNRTAKVTGDTRLDYSYDPAQQLASVSKTVGGVKGAEATFVHDAAGRMTQARSGFNNRSLTYDSRGQLAQVRDQGLLGTSTTDRRLDGDGNLLGTTVTSPLGVARTTNFTWDRSQAVPEVATTTSGGQDTGLLYGAGRALAIRGGQPDVFARDAHGSDLAVGDTADLSHSADYDAFGRPAPTGPIDSLLDEVLGLVGAGKDQAPLFGYRGEMHLGGNIHLRAREYAPALGRFTSPDPVPGRPGEAVLANPYPYAANDPLNQVDPLGLRPIRDRDLRCPACNPGETLEDYLALVAGVNRRYINSEDQYEWQLIGDTSEPRCARELVCPIKPVQDLFQDAFGPLTWMKGLPVLGRIDGNLRHRFLSRPSYIATNTMTALRLIYLEQYTSFGSFRDVLSQGLLNRDPSFWWWAFKATDFITADLKNVNPSIWSLLRAGLFNYRTGD